VPSYFSLFSSTHYQKSPLVLDRQTVSVFFVLGSPPFPPWAGRRGFRMFLFFQLSPGSVLFAALNLSSYVTWLRRSLSSLVKEVFAFVIPLKVYKALLFGQLEPLSFS